MYVCIFFFCSFSCFPDGFAVRNWSSRHPHESRQELPTGKNSCRPTDRRSHFSWPRAPVGEAVRNPIPDGISGIPDGFWLSGVSRFLVVVAVWTPRSAPAAARRRPGCLLGMVTLAVCFLILVCLALLAQLLPGERILLWQCSLLICWRRMWGDGELLLKESITQAAGVLEQLCQRTGGNRGPGNAAWREGTPSGTPPPARSWSCSAAHTAALEGEARGHHA